MAAAAADYDNDGDTDLFVGGVHRQALYRNEGGRFEEVAARAGVASGQWVVGAGWFDYDNDGRLDLLVVNYTLDGGNGPLLRRRRPAGSASTAIPSGSRRCRCPLPQSRRRHLRGRQREDGPRAAKGRGMGVAFADYDGDGRLDVYVANDKLPSFLLRNGKDGIFEETALLAGVSLPEHGQDVSAMGVDFRDYDNDGRPDIHVTALAGESFPLYRNTGRGPLPGRDASQPARARWWPAAADGATASFDLDNDGWKDLFTANAHVNDEIEKFQGDTYRQTNSVFQNRGDGHVRRRVEASPGWARGRRARTAGRPSATSTETAAWTWWSPRSALPPRCGATSRPAPGIGWTSASWAPRATATASARS